MALDSTGLTELLGWNLYTGRLGVTLHNHVAETDLVALVSLSPPAHESIARRCGERRAIGLSNEISGRIESMRLQIAEEVPQEGGSAVLSRRAREDRAADRYYEESTDEASHL